MASAGRPCVVCQHPNRFAIEMAIIHQTPATTISRQFVDVPVSGESILRHSKSHMHAILKPTNDDERATMLAEVRLLQRKTVEVLDAAVASKRVGTVALMAAVKETRANLELVAKLTGVLDERPQVNILAHPDWLAVQDRIITALAHHPSALEAVRDALALPG